MDEISESFKAWKAEYDKRRNLFEDWADEIKWLAIVAGFLFLHATLGHQKEALDYADSHLNLKQVVNSKPS